MRNESGCQIPVCDTRRLLVSPGFAAEPLSCLVWLVGGTGFEPVTPAV